MFAVKTQEWKPHPKLFPFMQTSQFSVNFHPIDVTTKYHNSGKGLENVFPSASKTKETWTKFLWTKQFFLALENNQCPNNGFQEL